MVNLKSRVLKNNIRITDITETPSNKGIYIIINIDNQKMHSLYHLLEHIIANYLEDGANFQSNGITYHDHIMIHRFFPEYKNVKQTIKRVIEKIVSLFVNGKVENKVFNTESSLVHNECVHKSKLYSIMMARLFVDYTMANHNNQKLEKGEIDPIQLQNCGSKQVFSKNIVDKLLTQIYTGNMHFIFVNIDSSDFDSIISKIRNSSPTSDTNLKRHLDKPYLVKIKPVDYRMNETITAFTNMDTMTYLYLSVINRSNGTLMHASNKYYVEYSDRVIYVQSIYDTRHGNSSVHQTLTDHICALKKWCRIISDTKDVFLTGLVKFFNFVIYNQNLDAKSRAYFIQDPINRYELFVKYFKSIQINEYNILILEINQNIDLKINNIITLRDIGSFQVSVTTFNAPKIPICKIQECNTFDLNLQFQQNIAMCSYFEYDFLFVLVKCKTTLNKQDSYTTLDYIASRISSVKCMIMHTTDAMVVSIPNSEDFAYVINTIRNVTLDEVNSWASMFKYNFNGKIIHKYSFLSNKYISRNNLKQLPEMTVEVHISKHSFDCISEVHINTMVQIMDMEYEIISTIVNKSDIIIFGKSDNVFLSLFLAAYIDEVMWYMQANLQVYYWTLVTAVIPGAFRIEVVAEVDNLRDNFTAAYKHVFTEMFDSKRVERLRTLIYRVCTFASEYLTCVCLLHGFVHFRYKIDEDEIKMFIHKHTPVDYD